MVKEIGGDTMDTEETMADNPPATDRDLGTGQGLQGGGERTQNRAAKAGKWQVAGDGWGKITGGK